MLLLVVCAAEIFSQSVPCLWFLLMMSFDEQKLLILKELNLSIIFMASTSMSGLRNFCLLQDHEESLLNYLLKALSLSFARKARSPSGIHCFMYVWCEGSNIIFSHMDTQLSQHRVLKRFLSLLLHTATVVLNQMSISVGGLLLSFLLGFIGQCARFSVIATLSSFLQLYCMWGRSILASCCFIQILDFHTNFQISLSSSQKKLLRFWLEFI